MNLVAIYSLGAEYGMGCQGQAAVTARVMVPARSRQAVDVMVPGGRAEGRAGQGREEPGLVSG